MAMRKSSYWVPRATYKGTGIVSDDALPIGSAGPKIPDNDLGILTGGEEIATGRVREVVREVSLNGGRDLRPFERFRKIREKLYTLQRRFR